MNEWARNHYKREPWKNYLHMDNIGFVNHNKAPGILIINQVRWLSLFPKEDFFLALIRFRNGIPPLHTCKVMSHHGNHWSILRPHFAPRVKIGCDHLDLDSSSSNPPTPAQHPDIVEQASTTHTATGKARPSKKARNRKKTQRPTDS